MSKERRAKVLIFIAAAVVTSALFIDFCDLVYRCGCRSLWAGADEHCNIHSPGPRHCPWCSIGTAGAAGVWAAIVAAQAGVVFLWPGITLAPRAVLALITFPVTGGILAVIIGLSKGYWA
jgi:hypothetical protein